MIFISKQSLHFPYCSCFATTAGVVVEGELDVCADPGGDIPEQLWELLRSEISSKLVLQDAEGGQVARVQRFGAQDHRVRDHLQGVLNEGSDRQKLLFSIIRPNFCLCTN